MNLERYEAAPDFPAYLQMVEKNADLWRGVYERVRLPADVIERARAIDGRWRLAALSEDWCGDAVNTLPVVARMAEAAGWDFRVFSRDDNPDLMDVHLTGTSRSIPVVILYREAPENQVFEEIGWWGPRPGEIQSWVMAEGLTLPSTERYKEVRRWYARDRGRTTAEELLHVFDLAEAVR
ncbi:MAG: thioredoxin family protein [Gemmatimonadota bacterium]